MKRVNKIKTKETKRVKIKTKEIKRVNKIIKGNV